jgi:hypothetical protein
MDNSKDVWVPLLGYNDFYKELYEINAGSLRIRRRDNRRSLRVTCTGRVQMMGIWVHVADVIHDHRTFRFEEDKVIEDVIPNEAIVEAGRVNGESNTVEVEENRGDYSNCVTTSDCLIIFILCVIAYMVWYTSVMHV